jgi:heme A synthase
MKGTWLHRCAVLLALLVFLLIATGASLTSVIRPLPGTPPSARVNPPMEVAAPLDRIHEIVAGVVAMLALTLAVSAPTGVRLAAWMAVSLVVIDAGLGIHSGAGMLPSLPGIFHALFAALLFSAVVAIAVLTSKSWAAPPAKAENLWPPLRKLAIWVPLLLVAQIALGAAFRHDVLGVLWHIMNAMIVLTLILVLGICALRMCSTYPTLRPAALALLIVTGVQVLLGFGVYITLLMVSENNMALMAAGAIHVLTGSLTLAAGVVLSLQISRL